MKAPVIGLMLALSLSGCSAVPLLTPPAGKVNGSTSTGATALRLGSLQFKPASSETMAKLSQRAANAPSAAPMAAEASAGMTADTSTKMAPAMMPSPYAYNSYFGGPFGQMKLESVTEATAGGASTGFLDLQANVIGPALADWAADARLLNTNGTLDADGNPLQGPESYPGELAWHASYASISRNEVLDFTVSGKETRVVRMHWVPVTIDVSTVKVDAKAAVAALAKAVTSRVRSKEEELGRDYFFDGAQGQAGVGIAVPAIAVVDPAPMPGIAVGEPSPQGPTTEVLYRLKAGGRWNVNLQAIGDHLVWELTYNTYYATNGGAAVSSPAAEPMPAIAIAPTKDLPPVEAKPYVPEPWTDESAYGMIDARTGELIRLRRPTSYTYSAVTPMGGATVRGGGTTASSGSAPDGKQ